jgi:hypothetical protein
MPVTVSTSYIANPETAERLCSGVRERFKTRLGELRISIVGGQSNDNWQLKMTTPDGSRQRVLDVFGPDRHQLEKVFDTLENMAAEMEAS